MTPPNLQAIDLSCIRQQRTLFANLFFALQSGDIILVEGENGSGKSSLLRLLVGLASPSNGCIHWQGNAIESSRDEYHKQLHYLSHTNGIKLGLTVWENVQLAGHLSFSPINDHADNVLEQFGLSAYKHTLAKYLSSGQQRKLALIRLFLFSKPLWVLDEPCTSLDAASQALFLSLLATHLQQGGMCVMSAHHAVAFQHVTPTVLRLSA